MLGLEVARSSSALARRVRSWFVRLGPGSTKQRTKIRRASSRWRCREASRTLGFHWNIIAPTKLSNVALTEGKTPRRRGIDRPAQQLQPAYCVRLSDLGKFEPPTTHDHLHFRSGWFSWLSITYPQALTLSRWRAQILEPNF